jgi:molecular chaperone GrpE (heat shock protein)
MQEEIEPSEAYPRDGGQSPADGLPVEWCAAVDAQLAGLRQLFEDKIREDAARGDLFDRLYRDLANYRDDFLFNNVTRRVLDDLIRLFDRVDRLLKQEVLEQLQSKDLIAHITSFRTEILQALRRQEVHPIEDGPGVFDETVQEAVDAAPVPRREDDQKVVAVVGRGFRYRGRVFRPERVIVGRFDARREAEDGYSDRN